MNKFIKGGTKIMQKNKYLISLAMPGGAGGKGWELTIRIIQTDTVTLT